MNDVNFGERQGLGMGPGRMRMGARGAGHGRLGVKDMRPGAGAASDDTEGMAIGRGFGTSNMYRFMVPVIAVCLARLGKAHGYQIAKEVADLTVTEAQLDTAGIYRMLRRMEMMGFVHSEWDTQGAGPAKRMYMMTDEGMIRLSGIMDGLRDLSARLGSLLRTYDGLSEQK